MPMSREEKEKVLSGFYLDGKAVQVFQPGSQEWSRGMKLGGADRPSWDFENFTYRLKPEPVAGWFVLSPSGEVSAFTNRHIAEQKAILWSQQWPSKEPHKAVYMVECDPPEGE